jgi:hypothetical protein
VRARFKDEFLFTPSLSLALPYVDLNSHIVLNLSGALFAYHHPPFSPHPTISHFLLIIIIAI